MSFLHYKTNYNKPHAKASFFRPFFDKLENDSSYKEPRNSYVEGTKSLVKNPVDKFDSLKVIDSQEKHLESWNSAHSKLSAEINKMQSWATSVECDTKQKSKKLDELTVRVESQRKIILELQMQKENLSIQLNKEIQERVPVLAQFYNIKELFSALRKKHKDLQSQLDTCHKAKKSTDAQCKKNADLIEDLSKKFSSMLIEYSENTLFLKNDLKTERYKNSVLKELCEQQKLDATKEQELHCKLIKNLEEKLSNFSEELKSEKSKVFSLQQEKDNLHERMYELEKNKEVCEQRLKDTEKQLTIEVESKLEAEKKYKSENTKVNSLNKKFEELEELKNKQKTEYEESFMICQTKINSLEKCACELKQKLEECEKENEEFKVTLKEREKEKCSLEMEILAITKENAELKGKSIIDAKKSEEIISDLIKEKDNLNTSLNLVKKDLDLSLSDYENLFKTCVEKDKNLSQIAEELKIATSKIEELSVVENKYNEAIQKLEKMEADALLNLNNITSKEHEIKELLDFKLKYDECLQKIKDLEESLNSKSEQLQLKDDKIKELNTMEEKIVVALNNITALENELASKNELLISKDHNIEDLNNVAKMSAAELKRLKDECLHKILLENLLEEKEKKIADLNAQLNKKNIECEKLEYENFEMKNNLENDKKSVQVCLECEIMRDKLQGLEQLQNTLLNTEKELLNKMQQASNVEKMLLETEDNFDQMRLIKEQEIIKYKNTIQSLHFQLKILKVKVNEAEKFKSENDKLQLTIEELTLQNTEDVQRLKLEIEKLKKENEALKTEKNMPVSDEFILKNQLKVDISRKNDKLTVENAKWKADSPQGLLTPKEDTTHKSPFLMKTYKRANKKLTVENHKWEADSSQGVLTPKEDTTYKSLFVKKTCKWANKKVTSKKISQSTPLLSENRKRAWETESSDSECLEIVFDKVTSKKISQSTPLLSENRKRAWETESSDSECLEIVFDKSAKKVMGLTPKIKTPSITFAPGKLTPILKNTHLTPSQEKRRDMLEIIDEEVSNRDQHRMSFSSKASPFSSRSTKAGESMYFFSSKRNIKEVTPVNSPWIKKITPSLQLSEKKFKTPLEKRE